MDQNDRLDITSLPQLQRVCSKLVQQIQHPAIICLHGNLGSGKTTFVQAFLREIDDSINVTSPTYSIVNEYESKSGLTIYHFDLYRMNQVEELIHIGFEEYLDNGDYIFIEWPEIGKSFLGNDVFHLYFKNANFERSLTILNE